MSAARVKLYAMPDGRRFYWSPFTGIKTFTISTLNHGGGSTKGQMPKDKSSMPEMDADWKAISREMREKFLARVEKMWNRNFASAKTILEESETKKMVLTFKAAFDFSEPEVKMDTAISYSQVHRESAEDTFENPIDVNSPPGEPLPGVDSEAKAESKKLRAKKRGAKPVFETANGRMNDEAGVNAAEE